MEKFREFNGLTGLRATKLSENEEDKILPENGKIKDCLTNSSMLICDIESDDIWVFVKYNLNSSDGNKKNTAELKGDKDSNVKYFRNTLEKFAKN